MTGGAILSADETRAAEQALFATGMPEYDLMERAGTAAADIILPIVMGREVLVLCGPGNNGGDGFVIARLLQNAGISVRVSAFAESTTSSSRQARAMWTGSVESLDKAASASVLIDALFGTGLTRGLEALVAHTLARLVADAKTAFAIDLPSGLDADSGTCLSPVPRFDLCIALGALKPSHVLYPGLSCFSALKCVDIGLDCSGVKAHMLPAPQFAVPGFDAHKYTRGYVGVVGGEMAGAGALAASAAARSGAGYIVYMQGAGIPALPHAVVTRPANAIDVLQEQLTDLRPSAVLVGSGLGRDDMARRRFDAALQAGHSLIIDGDGLYLMQNADFERLPFQTILTPHSGEFTRLFGALPGSKIDQARAAAKWCGAVVMYKGSDTVIAAPDGRVCVSNTGSPWLSTAGTGDVLAGLCVGRLAVTSDAFTAACEAVWLHAEASNRAGPAFIADDLLQYIAPSINSALT